MPIALEILTRKKPCDFDCFAPKLFAVACVFANLIGAVAGVRVKIRNKYIIINCLCVFPALAVLGCSSAVEAREQSAPRPDLSTALSNFARQRNIELIFDPAQVAGTRVTPSAAPSVREALALLLANTGFTYVQSDARTFVIVTRSRKSTDVVKQPLPSAGPEIFVTGRRSQNVDLVRGRDEVQPYWITSGQNIVDSGAATLDDYFRSQMTMNRDGTPLSQQSASPRSQINLRGFGQDQTLILVDGRRFASIPSAGAAINQADINAIPIEAIDRVEVLASSAGGIFGVGATGGVVNVVLKRDYSGAFFSADNGITARGDGIEHRLYGRVGWQSRGGSTSIMVSGSYTHDGGLLEGDRPYEAEMHAIRSQYGDSFTSNSLNIQSATGEPLTFTAANGGTSLGASRTYMPLGTSALGAAGLATLLTNAGKQDSSLAADGQGRLASLVSQTTRLSVIASVRQDLGERSNIFLDYVRLDDRGYRQGPGFLTGYQMIDPGVAGNPFNQAIFVSFPTNVAPRIAAAPDSSQRFSLGFIRRFGGGWTMAADGAYSVTSIVTSNVAVGLFAGPSVFSGVSALDADLQSTFVDTTVDSTTNHLQDFNLRLSGPIMSLPGGRATITATAEYRHEWTAGDRSDVTSASSGYTYKFSTISGKQTNNVFSAFGDARFPILPEAGPFRPWRGLSAQLALRLDRYNLFYSGGYAADTLYDSESVLATTMGLQSHPIAGLMLRASYSTSAMPPTPYLLQGGSSLTPAFGFSDPQRGGDQPYDPNYSFLVNGRNSALHAQRTISFSAGMVVQPDKFPHLRLSADYTRLVMHDGIETFAYGNIQYFVDNEALFPGRVQRAPLAPADQALGYTAGRITEIDTGPLQIGTANLQSCDISLSYDMPLGKGQLQLQADGDWEISYRRVDDPTLGAYDLVGHADGPLAWRLNGAMTWSSNRWSFGARAQFYAPYSLADGAPISVNQVEALGVSPSDVLALQQSQPRVSAQAYFDLSVTFRPKGKRGIQIRATVANIFDKQPTVVANTLPASISQYMDLTPGSNVASFGDVLGRRIAVNISAPLRF